MKVFRTRYRVLYNRHKGYIAQFRYWWSPFWMECFEVNKSSTVTDSKIVIEQHKCRVCYYE